MKTAEHLKNRSLIRFLDGELDASEMVGVRSHLADCDVCRRKCDGFANLSSRVAAVIRAQPVSDAGDVRQNLSALLFNRARVPAGPSPSKILKRFAWGMTIAATLALGIVLSPKINRTAHSKVESPTAASVSSISVSSIDIDGESFIALPYSNPDLPLTAPRIVEMQVPVSSLAAAGIFFQPSPNGAADRTVLANVLLGLDGQPLGVHVLSAD